jgi:hypothetical protein|tara:strand:- start:53 stop:238 length:186 start_codon:yes stop_codon:yes gene_type:complete
MNLTTDEMQKAILEITLGGRTKIFNSIKTDKGKLESYNRLKKEIKNGIDKGAVIEFPSDNF